MSLEKKKSKYILSLNGGGIRGIIILYFLKYLEKDLLEKTGKTIYETFDMFGGTSVGSLITGTIVYHKFTIDEILNIYTDDVFKSIFTKNTSLYSKILYGPIYNGQYKTDVLDRNFGKTIMSSAEKPVLFTVYSVDEQRPRFYKSYSVNEQKQDPCLVSEIINASSSPPGYFGSIKYTDSEGVHYGVDGAVFANNPCDCIYADALQLFKGDDIKVLSLGTGNKNITSLHQETTKWGPLQWLLKGSIFDIIMESSPEDVNYRMKQFTEAFGHTYMYIDHKTSISIDDVTKITELKEMGYKWYMETKDKLFEDFF